MPRYYRHIRQGDRLIEDLDGIEHLDLNAARAEALNGIRDLLGEAIVITDEARRELIAIPFIEALPPRLSEALLAVASSTSKSQ